MSCANTLAVAVVDRDPKRIEQDPVLAHMRLISFGPSHGRPRFKREGACIPRLARSAD